MHRKIFPVDADSSKDRRRVWIGLFTALGAALLFLALFVPTLDTNKRQRGNEAAAVSRLRTLNELQKKYAGANPQNGFAWQLSQLKTVLAVDDPYDRNEYLLTGEQTGY